MNGRTLKASLTTLAVTVVLSGASLNANALALGEINVYSSLGQPFRAEVDVTQLSAEEANSLKASIGSPASYRSAGVEYNPAVANIRVSVQKRPNGKTFLRLTSNQPINEPYLGIVVDTNWAAGRVVRDFTILLDPPEVKRSEVAVTGAQTSTPPVTQPQAGNALPPVIMESTTAPPPAARPEHPPVAHSPAPASGNIPDSTPASTKASLAQQHAQSAAVDEPARPSRRSKKSRAERASSDTNASGPSVTVQRGDTAGRLAAANLPQGVSLDQMLVAMLRANPQAFVGGNVNRLRSGAVLQIPSAEQANAVSHAQARRTIVAQSRDFNRYRQNFARQAPQVQVADSGQSAAGSVRTDIKAPATTTSDGSRVVVSGSTADAKRAQTVAQQAEKKEHLSRVEELKRTKDELNALAAASEAAKSTTPSTAATAPATQPPGLTLPVSKTPAAPTISPSASAAAATPLATAASQATPSALPPVVTSSAPASDASAAAMASASEAVSAAHEAASAASEAASVAAAVPAPAPKPRPAPVPPPPMPEPSFMDGVMENPLPWGLGGLAILGGVGYLLARRKKQTPSNDGASDSEFLESRIQNDSFFGTSGGQQVNTQAPSQATATSMAYSPSQLDAAGDVDPVAEADVYLAYGRDMQAEEILKEALLTTPDRIAVHRKLLEIYAKRRDAKAFEELAKQLRERTGGQGEDWAKVAELGNELDPTNTLYRGGVPGENLLSKTGPATAAVFGSSTLPSPDQMAFPPNAKLDLELSGDSRLLAQHESDHLQQRRNGADLAAFSSPPSTLQPEEGDSRDQPLAFDVDFDLPGAQTPAATQKPAAVTAPAVETVSSEAPKLDDFNLDDFKLDDALAEQPTKADALSGSKTAPSSLDADFGLNFLSADTVPAAVEPEANTKPAYLADDTSQGGMLEFDMTALSVDPDSRSFDGQDSIQPLEGDEDDPIATKLSLAREFHSIGDVEGARALIKEVIAEADGAAKARAERFLAELG